MPNAVYLVAPLLCPVVMGVMMWIMMRPKPNADAASPIEVQQLRRELDELRTEQPGRTPHPTR